MDPLSDVLALLKPQSYLTAGLDAGGDWAIRFENRAGTIKCYAVTGGACWLRVDGVDEEVRLTAGDCFMLPSGRSFTLASDLALLPAPAKDVLTLAPLGGVVVHNSGGDVMLAGARFEVNGRKVEALLGALPPVVHLRATEDQAALRWSIERMMAEMHDSRPGASLAAHHLAHLMLLQVLRLYLSRQAGDQVGWFYALADPYVSKAIVAMHADPAHRWTLSELAIWAGMSRSVFAQRFRERVGETPIAYLTRWRMMLAAERLACGRDPLAQVARSFGYESENAFNTAFSRVMGCSPRRYARAEASSSAGSERQTALNRQRPAERTGSRQAAGLQIGTSHEPCAEPSASCVRLTRCAPNLK